ncbi:hypothetical protein F7725_011414 [Dissostichus mawsoni]|uniref:Uncharacterized protein n=1 Tax=Dissostichus mawsoni TaxID=36200 RepID=A0A7J5Z9G9_DISMA|nr:hypothetical protein F7725_011414 [Dissostichus mawsoni]
MTDLFLVLYFIFFILAHLISRRILVLLVLRHQVIHVALGLSELHLIHSLAGVPVEEGLAAEHGSELLRDPPEQLLDGCAVANEVSDTFGEGMTLKVFMMRSGYSSRILLMSSVPIPEPVPPPREWVS